MDYRLPTCSKWPCLWDKGRERKAGEATTGVDARSYEVKILFTTSRIQLKNHTSEIKPSLSNNQGSIWKQACRQPQGTAMRKGSGDHLPLRAQDPAGSKLSATLGSPISGGCGWAQAGPKGRAGVGRDGLWLTSPQLVETAAHPKEPRETIWQQRHRHGRGKSVLLGRQVAAVRKRSVEEVGRRRSKRTDRVLTDPMGEGNKFNVLEGMEVKKSIRCVHRKSRKTSVWLNNRKHTEPRMEWKGRLGLWQKILWMPDWEMCANSAGDGRRW